MKLYPIPGGGWAGTEADWKAGMKARGLNPKDFEATKTREVPTGKKELMEFLTFFAVDVYRTGGDIVVTGAAAVDVEALRAAHNPDPDAPPPAPVVTGTIGRDHVDLVQLFTEAPIKLQAELAVGFIDRLTADI